MTSFDSLGLSERALEAVKLLGYSEPTPVQQKAIPVALEGRDLIAAAKTGTGKTAAFSLPLLDRIEYAQGGQGPLALVVTPTRELAEQIGQVCETIAGATHHRVLTVVGGLSYKPQTERLRRGVDVLIATPGRLIDLMDQKAVRLGDVQALVLDEADRMLDMGFWPSVKRIVAATPTTRQTLLFSATIDDAVNKHAKTLLRKPARVEVAHRGDVADAITQYIVRTPKLARPELLSALLREKGSRPSRRPQSSTFSAPPVAVAQETLPRSTLSQSHRSKQASPWYRLRPTRYFNVDLSRRFIRKTLL